MTEIEKHTKTRILEAASIIAGLPYGSIRNKVTWLSVQEQGVKIQINKTLSSQAEDDLYQEMSNCTAQEVKIKLYNVILLLHAIGTNCLRPQTGKHSSDKKNHKLKLLCSITIKKLNKPILLTENTKKIKNLKKNVKTKNTPPNKRTKTLKSPTNKLLQILNKNNCYVFFYQELQSEITMKQDDNSHISQQHEQSTQHANAGTGTLKIHLFTISFKKKWRQQRFRQKPSTKIPATPCTVLNVSALPFLFPTNARI